MSLRHLIGPIIDELAASGTVTTPSTVADIVYERHQAEVQTYVSNTALSTLRRHAKDMLTHRGSQGQLELNSMMVPNWITNVVDGDYVYVPAAAATIANYAEFVDVVLSENVRAATAEYNRHRDQLEVFRSVAVDSELLTDAAAKIAPAA